MKWINPQQTREERTNIINVLLETCGSDAERAVLESIRDDDQFGCVTVKPDGLISLSCDRETMMKELEEEEPILAASLDFLQSMFPML